MIDLLKMMGADIDKLTTLWLIVVFFGSFAFLLFIRFIGRVFPFRQHDRVVLLSDLILAPAALISIDIAVTRFLGPDAVDALRTSEIVISTIFWLLGGWMISRGVNLVFWEGSFKKATGTETPRLIRGFSSASIYLFVLFGIFTFVFERPATGLMVSTGIIVGVMGFSLQAILSDLFAGLAITVERPFRVGDRIELPEGRRGKVLDITWRSTRILSPHNSVYIVPNSIAAGSVLHNYDQPDPNYTDWYLIKVDASVSPNLVKQIMLEAALSCKGVLRNPSPRVYLDDASTQPYAYKLLVHYKNFASHYEGKSELFAYLQAGLLRSGINTSSLRYEVLTQETSKVEVHVPTEVESLQRVEIFEPLFREDLELMARLCRRESFSPGDIIIKDQDEGSSLFVITAGVVAVEKADADGKTLELARLGAGKCIGEMSLLSGAPRSADVKAITYVNAIEVPKSALERVLSQKPELADRLADVMGQRQMENEARMRKPGEGGKPDSIKNVANEIVFKIRNFFGLGSDGAANGATSDEAT